MAHFYAARSASLCITLFGALTNSALTLHVLSAWQQLKWGDVESEWAGDSWPQVVDGVKVMWALLSLYFISAASVCAIGFVGSIRSKASFVRFYRDYSIADFSFCSLLALGATYAAFISSARAGICEEFSHHPQLMRDMHELGLNSENCEHWLERAIVALVGIMFILLVIRLHFLLAVSSFYSQLTRQHTRSSSCSASSSHLAHSHSSSAAPQQRILLVPFTASMDPDVEMVYTPVPRNSLPRDVATAAKEVIVSPSNYEHRHRHQRHRSRESSKPDMGKIRLPISRDEGLLPSYPNSESGKA
ncbi:hypothetical protein AGABI2DRAFT_195711 [Agaricus bisporus var. bisporus H97]|uniref:hypothetical protein n=1 Tax=Agaricus bisporus var. bisporus (strain H97 / ATCC MYA-4626 / FGSC 10389) TaxID=936046 RepID=UPI00029F64BD|nr:hypothetical protein AGABI2DRAFT_195711 [Agaricus bisporus var. bisporus H97]EKV42365.1 hypothetical protein AGABI2DRAFT_195711 [Agaricus bisporus var. bisporus H97]